MTFTQQESSRVKYFAYGSNMDAATMAEVAPGSLDLGTALLRDHRLAFTRRSVRTHAGVADVVPAPGSTVWGVIYELTETGLAAIDRKEGHDWAYIRTPQLVQPTAGGEPVEALTYTVREKEPVDIAPSPEYLTKLLAAARARGFPESYVSAVAHAAPTA
jgi:cation transport regulator ChaC